MSSDVVVLNQVVKHFYRKKRLPRNRDLSGIQQFASSFKNYKEVVKAVDGISFQVKSGQIYGILGANGSGKSTLIRHINRLIDPTSGEVSVEGTNVMELDQKNLIQFRRHKMRMVFQRFGLFPHTTVMENVG